MAQEICFEDRYAQVGVYVDDVGEFGELVAHVLLCGGVCEDFMAEGGVCGEPGLDVFLAVLVYAMGPGFLPEFGGEGVVG